MNSPPVIVKNSGSLNRSFCVRHATTWKTSDLKRSNSNASSVAKKNPRPPGQRNIPKLFLKFAHASSELTLKSKPLWSPSAPTSSRIFRSNTCAVSIHKSNSTTRREMSSKLFQSLNGTLILSKSSSRRTWRTTKSRNICGQTRFKFN